MAKRKADDKDDDVTNPLTVKRKKIKFEDLPPINSIDDLIMIAKTSKFYKNINMLMLWDILPHLVELQTMIGMKSVKDSIFYQVIYYLQGMHLRNIDGDYLHCIITGAAGAGKTTIAQIISKIYQNIGILSHNSKFKLAHREDFVGEYLGQTATKTKKLLTSCLGGVIFVDEIYALSAGNKDKDSYAKEAIDTINAFLSEHKNDFVFIGAGYKDQVQKCFLDMNQGLQRRFAWYHDIEKYTEQEIAEILIKMIKENSWELDLDINYIKETIRSNEDIFKNTGGSCENLFSKIKLTHSKRVFGLSNDVKFIITKEDFDKAIDMMKKYYSEKQDKARYDYYT
jgi:replication-associated recombination protein RarA